MNAKWKNKEYPLFVFYILSSDSKYFSKWLTTRDKKKKFHLKMIFFCFSLASELRGTGARGDYTNDTFKLRRYPYNVMSQNFSREADQIELTFPPFSLSTYLQDRACIEVNHINEIWNLAEIPSDKGSPNSITTLISCET